MRKTNFSVKDFSLFYGLPGTVILLISLLVAVKTSQDFGNDTFIRSGVFVGMNALQWLIRSMIGNFKPEKRIRVSS